MGDHKVVEAYPLADTAEDPAAVGGSDLPGHPLIEHTVGAGKERALSERKDQDCDESDQQRCLGHRCGERIDRRGHHDAGQPTDGDEHPRRIPEDEPKRLLDGVKQPCCSPERRCR